ncbi:conserved phage C-terminal domain-containing protein [Marinitoga sp. 1137]|uniref:conserved phage C-terminal domain-containing protein n=1 Tax=Marinitoga sp. 1137 TaxID=1545835 RepID=UPI0009529430|nr:conserved phage C-terminal domain-containing protein [Marinitoga sp. 1137]
MDIFKLLERLEIEEEKRPLPATAYKLYVMLVIKANKLYWDGPLYFSHRRLAAIVGVSRNALSSAVQELVNRNLITYKKGKKDHSVSKFWFPDLPDKKHITGSKNEPDSEPDVEPDTEPVREPVPEPDREPIYKTKHKQKQNNNIYNVAIEILDYLNEKANKKFKPTKGNLKYINARLKEKYQKEDFFKVIDLKVKQWINDPKMKQYLRPSTLFNSEKFDSYLNESFEKEEKEENYYIEYPFGR